ncbi:MAG TPA: hypothetical protein VFO60_11880 [Candidatus Dormibacteraeota bacterium]|nr:hypothetical protein [Candidatus Dormibacteraeota bacterium]
MTSRRLCAWLMVIAVIIVACVVNVETRSQPSASGDASIQRDGTDGGGLLPGLLGSPGARTPAPWWRHGTPTPSPADGSPAPGDTPQPPAPTDPPAAGGAGTPAPGPGHSGPTNPPQQQGQGSGPTGCLAAPSRCGYPDATNTGVPAGTQLAPFTCPWALEFGACPVRQAGYQFVGMDDTGIGFDVYAQGVSFRNMRIHDTPSGMYGIAFHDGASGTVSSSEIYNVDKGLWGTNWQADHLNVHGTRQTAAVETNCDGSSACPISTQHTILTDSYLHTSSCPAGMHCSMFRTFFNFANITARHNTMLTDNTVADAGPYDAVNLTNENNSGPVTNWVIEDNLLDGGAWTVYLLRCHDDPCPATAQGVVLTGNRFGVPQYGPILTDLGASELTCTGNVDDQDDDAVTWQGLDCS